MKHSSEQFPTPAQAPLIDQLLRLTRRIVEDQEPYKATEHEVPYEWLQLDSYHYNNAPLAPVLMGRLCLLDRDQEGLELVDGYMEFESGCSRKGKPATEGVVGAVNIRQSLSWRQLSLHTAARYTISTGPQWANPKIAVSTRSKFTTLPDSQDIKGPAEAYERELSARQEAFCNAQPVSQSEVRSMIRIGGLLAPNHTGF